MRNTNTALPPRILEIGTPYPLDDQGYIVNDCTIDNLANHWSRLLEDTLQHILKSEMEKIHSIYVRGSVARGTPIDYVSDLDLLIISTEQTQYRKDKLCGIKSKYPFCTDIEYVELSIENCTQDQPINRFLIKTQCICIWGENLQPSIPEFKIGPDLFMFLPRIERNIETVRKKFEHCILAEEKKSNCRWIMKRILRAEAELIMQSEQCYIRDLYPCHKYFSKAYPEWEEQSKLALEYAVYPTDDITKILHVIDTLGMYLVESGKRYE